MATTQKKQEQKTVAQLLEFNAANSSYTVTFSNNYKLTFETSIFSDYLTLSETEYAKGKLDIKKGTIVFKDHPVLSISIDGVVADLVSIQNAQRIVGKYRGEKKSTEKAQAARENGCKGGRPKKEVTQQKKNACTYESFTQGSLTVSLDYLPDVHADYLYVDFDILGENESDEGEHVGFICAVLKKDAEQYLQKEYVKSCVNVVNKLITENKGLRSLAHTIEWLASSNPKQHYDLFGNKT